MIIILSSSGHYPSRLVEVTEEEYEEIRAVEQRAPHGELQGSEEGQAMIKKLFDKEQLPKPPTVVVYV